MKKIRWKVAEKPTGRWRSFSNRAWPDAIDEKENLMVSITCEDEYSPSRVKTGEHAPLRVLVYDYSGHHNRKRYKLSKEFKTLKEAKEAAETFLKNHESFFRKEPEDEIYINIKGVLDDVKNNAGIEDFIEKVKPTGGQNFLRPATISHIAYQFVNGKRMEAATYLDRWIDENK